MDTFGHYWPTICSRTIPETSIVVPIIIWVYTFYNVFQKRNHQQYWTQLKQVLHYNVFHQ